MKEIYDVIIIGAGPSGACAAKKLISEGFNVLVLEKKKLPRYKICSGIIFQRSREITEEYFGKIPEHVYVRPKMLKGVRLWNNGEYEDWPFNKEGDGAPNIWRSEYDQWLIKNSGAVVRDGCAVTGFSATEDFVTVDCFDFSKNKTTYFTAKYLISAEGSKSLTRTKLDHEFEKGLKWFIACQYYYEGSSGLDPYYYHGFLEPQYGEGYACFSIKDNLQILGTAVRRGMKILPYLHTYTKMLKKSYGLNMERLIKKSSCLGNNMCSTGNFYLGKENILFVGEAAGFLNAFGEGISCALSTGIWAAEAIGKCIRFGGNALATYEELAKKEKRKVAMSWKLGAKIAGRNLMPE